MRGIRAKHVRESRIRSFQIKAEVSAIKDLLKSIRRDLENQAQAGVNLHPEAEASFSEDFLASPLSKNISIEDEKNFRKVIQRMIDNEPREEWRKAMARSTCFVRMWVNPINGSLCENLDCDLLLSCKQNWECVKGGYFEEEMDLSDLIPKKKGYNPRRKSGRYNPSRKAVIKGRQMYEWVNRGCPTDVVAEDVFNFLGNPPILPNTWYYPTQFNEVSELDAAKLFCVRYGSGPLVSMGTLSHTYFFNGLHLFRISLATQRIVNIEICENLEKAVMAIDASILKYKKIKIDARHPKTKDYFPKKCCIKSKKDLFTFKCSIQRIEGVKEYLKENGLLTL